MAAFEIIALDTATPQLRAPGFGDTYLAPRAMEVVGNFTCGNVLLASGSVFLNSGSSIFQFSNGATLRGDAASNSLALRNFANAQTFNIYNTFTDASNYERGFVRWVANVLEIGAERAGTGTLRDVRLFGNRVEVRAQPASGPQFVVAWDAANFWSVRADSVGNGTLISSGPEFQFKTNGGANTALSVVGSQIGINGGVFGGWSFTLNGSFPLIVRNSGATQFQIDGSGNVYINGSIDVPTSSGTKIGTATNQKLGFWNATPVVQPTTAVAAATLVSNLGTILTATDTFDGYTVQQVVKALRNTGLLA